jgi:hypothetical protein
VFAHHHGREALAIANEVIRSEWSGEALQYLGLIILRQSDFLLARQQLVESLRLYTAANRREQVASVLEGLARLYAATAQAGRAAALLGTAAALREQIGAPAPPFSRDTIEQTATAVRQRIGRETFTAAYQSGRLMTAGEAAALIHV